MSKEMDDEIQAFLEADHAHNEWFWKAYDAIQTGEPYEKDKWRNEDGSMKPGHPHQLFADGVKKWGRAWSEREYDLKLEFQKKLDAKKN